MKNIIVYNKEKEPVAEKVYDEKGSLFQVKFFQNKEKAYVPPRKKEEIEIDFFDEEDRINHERMQDRKGYFNYQPRYKERKINKERRGNGVKFNQKEIDYLYNFGRFQDISGRNKDEKGVNSSYMQVNLRSNEGDISKFENGYVISIGKYTGYGDATDIDKLIKHPVFIKNIEEVADYLKENNY